MWLRTAPKKSIRTSMRLYIRFHNLGLFLNFDRAAMFNTEEVDQVTHRMFKKQRFICLFVNQI